MIMWLEIRNLENILKLLVDFVFNGTQALSG